MKKRVLLSVILTVLLCVAPAVPVYGTENGNTTDTQENITEDNGQQGSEETNTGEEDEAIDAAAVDNQNTDGSSEAASTENSTTVEGNATGALNIESPSALLMELNSGQVIFEKDADTARRPASVTKIMTMLLAFDAISSGQLSLDGMITVSEHAASMGGSQVYLEVGETQSVEDMLKCMIISSANDAAVAIGEAIAGSEEAFVAMMNEKAKELGMNNTSFANACGLEAKGHVMSARDIAILSRELLLKHPEVLNYTTIWMDTIVHHTRRGDSEFGLASTNKFLKKYEGANGLKTGYTSAAGFSMSATATRNGTILIAVVMGSKTKDIRYSDAAKLLDYGFANCNIYEDSSVLDGNDRIDITGGVKNQVSVKAENNFSYVFIGNASAGEVTKKLVVTKDVAPIKSGEVGARMEYELNGTPLGG
ncbi:MAG: D-alanyl-D-alanine carboxypeptidase, partial [Lachnospiraceae bacterium]|nr:D-alanyl-D-alanine carboxypeptidase [Lachnospiraceae bacterium]